MGDTSPNKRIRCSFYKRSLFICLLSTGQAVFSNETCSYTTYKWNVEIRQAVQHARVSKPYAEIIDKEVDPDTGCTVCEEDQIEIKLAGVAPFKICKQFAEPLRKTLSELQTNGFPIEEVIGYRVGMTRGEADAEGNRTQFSNHSFGIALDINPTKNGLYENCIHFGPQCRLRKGGHWLPDQPGSLQADGPVVLALKALGFRWGGEIAGRQKDFMHFSPSGY